MDNYRQPMYNRYNRNMGGNLSQRRGANYTTPTVDAGSCGHYDSKVSNNAVDNLPLAMAYVPMQKWRDVSDACEGLKHGTIFQELVLPYCAHYHGMRGER